MFSFHSFSQGSASPGFWASPIIIGGERRKITAEPHPTEVNVSCIKAVSLLTCKENMIHSCSLIQDYGLELKKSKEYFM